MSSFNPSQSSNTYSSPSSNPNSNPYFNQYANSYSGPSYIRSNLSSVPQSSYTSGLPSYSSIPSPSYYGSLGGRTTPIPTPGVQPLSFRPSAVSSPLSSYVPSPSSLPPSLRSPSSSFDSSPLLGRTQPFNPPFGPSGLPSAWAHHSPSFNLSNSYPRVSSNAGPSPASYQPLDTSFLRNPLPVALPPSSLTRVPQPLDPSSFRNSSSHAVALPPSSWSGSSHPFDPSSFRYPSSFTVVSLPQSPFSGASLTQQPPSLSGRAHFVNTFSSGQGTLPSRNYEATLWTPFSLSTERSPLPSNTLVRAPGRFSLPFPHRTNSSSLKEQLEVQQSLRRQFDETLKLFYQMDAPPERPFSMGATQFAFQINPQTTVFVDPVAISEFYQRASAAQQRAFQAQLAQLTSRREAFDPSERRLSTMQQVNTFVINALHNPRVHSALKATTGFFEASAGAALTCTPLAPLGAVLLVHGADRFSSGMYVTMTGKQASTMTSQLLQKVGMSPEKADQCDDNLNFVGTLGAGGLAYKFTQEAAVTQLVTSSQFKLPPPYISEAYLAAKSGGRHATLIDLYRGKTAKEILKGINSYEKQIALHKDKIMSPSKYYPDWNKLDPRRRLALIDKKWPAEIECCTEQMKVLQTILEQKR